MKTTIPNTVLDPNHADKFVEFFNIIQSAVHKIAVDHGWWDSKGAVFLKLMALSDDNKLERGSRPILKEIAASLESRNDGEMIALMHSELSEALEFLRHGNPASDHIPEFSGVEEELADVIIRICDYAQKRGFNVAGAMVAKMAFNHGRPHKHNKAF